jgi:hypothetical protein
VEPAAVLGTACGPGAYRCTNELLETCSDDRSGWVLAETCANPAECNLNSGTCRPCTPGERMCRNEELEQCDAMGAWQPQETCLSPELCSISANRLSGMCQPAACDNAGLHDCDGAKLVRCSEGRDRIDVVALCATPELCDAAYADELAASGARGACKPPVCGPNPFSCEGATLRHCDFDRAAWTDVATCDSAELCNAGLGACVACEAGTVECNGPVLRRCTAGGTWETLDTCASAALCDAGAGSCADAECDTPGRLACGAGGLPFLEVCSDALAWEVLEVCADVALCSTRAGRCLEPACDAGATRCHGNRQEHCSRDRTRWDTLTTCGDGEVCSPGDGCLPGPCTEGSVRCNLASLERCASGHFQEELRCETALLCNAETASCGTPACSDDPGYVCSGPIIRRCRAGRVALDDFRTCPDGTTCDADPGVGTGVPECDVCTPSVYECDGLTLLRCASNGQLRETVETCRTSCSVTDGVPACE